MDYGAIQAARKAFVPLCLHDGSWGMNSLKQPSHQLTPNNGCKNRTTISVCLFVYLKKFICGDIGYTNDVD